MRVHPPDTDTARAEGACDDHREIANAVAVMGIEQRVAPGKVGEGAALRLQGALAPVQSAGFPVGTQPLNRQEARQRYRQRDHRQRHQQRCPVVGSDEPDEVILGNDEHQGPVPSDHVGQWPLGDDDAPVIGFHDVRSRAEHAQPVVGRGQERIADLVETCRNQAGPLLLHHPLRIGESDQPSLVVDDHRPAAAADLQAGEEFAERIEADVDPDDAVGRCAVSRRQGRRCRDPRLLVGKEDVDT